MIERSTQTNEIEINPPSTPAGLHRLVVTGAVCTFILVFIGGTVTSNDAGMVIPDWPTVEGGNMFLFPPSKWVGGKLFEHVHRLTGAAVGMLMIAAAVWTQLREPRRWVRVFAWCVLAAVIAQGVMGGLRVTERSVYWAAVHGCFAQLFFSATLCFALVTSRAWTRPAQPPIPPSISPKMERTLRAICLATNAAVFGQLIAGAVYRHFAAGLAYHVVGAIAVTAVVSLLVMFISGEFAHDALSLRIVKAMGALLVIQLLLGIFAYVSTQAHETGRPATFWEWFTPSMHVAIGASILACSIGLTASVFRSTGRMEPSPSPAVPNMVTTA